MSNVQLSVCLVTYNHVRYIEEAIQSVLAQKLTVDWELIISDDCSTDGTQDIVRRYAAQQPQIVRPILRERNLGAFVHVTELLRAARGEFVAYLDGDDKYTDASKLQIQIEYLRARPGCAGCFHDLAVVSANGDTVHESLLAAQGSTFRPIVQQADLFNAGEIAQINTWLFRRKCIEDLPAWVADFPIDKSLAFHIADFGDWGYIDRKMSLYRLHGGGIYSPLPAHHQDQMLLKQMKILYSERTYRVRYNDIMRAKICHYSMTVARAYRSTSRFRYVKHLAEYVLYHPRRMTALKVILGEEILQQRARENKVK